MFWQKTCLLLLQYGKYWQIQHIDLINIENVVNILDMFTISSTEIV